MGNVASISNLTSAQIASLLEKENPAYETAAKKIFHGDDYLSLCSGNYLLSLDFNRDR